MRVHLGIVGGVAAIALSGFVAIPVTAAATAASAAPAAAVAPAAATTNPYASGSGIEHSGLAAHLAATTLSAGAYKAAAATAPVVIGVDNTPPAGKNWTYTHYFPESNVNVPQGGVVLFQWNPGNTNGLHTVTFVPNNQTVAQVRAAYPTVAKQSDGTAIPPQTYNPSNPTCSTSPQAPPCTFDGTSVLNSGVIPNATGAAFAVQIGANATPGTYHYICLIHPAMEGTLNVVAAGQPASAQGALATQAASELAGLNAGAFTAEAAASKPTYSTNADGTRTWEVHVGMTVDDVDLLEYLPGNVPIRKGDSVKFDGSGTTQEPHSVTSPNVPPNEFPLGPGNCINSSGSVVGQANSNVPPSQACPSGSQPDQPINFTTYGPPNLSSLYQGEEAIVTGRSDAQAAGANASYTVKFTNNGTYAFFCFFHTNMGGIVATQGYRLGGADGAAYTQGNLDFFGAGSPANSPVVAEPSTLSQQGYWIVTADGHTKAFGDAANVGNVPVKLASPIVGAVAGADPHGLYLVAKDGGVFALGDATYFGSMGGKHLNAPIVGIATDTNGSGYDLVASDGGVFTFGMDTNNPNGPPTPRFYGSMGGKHLNSPIVGMADLTDDSGYVMVAQDGGIFTFGAATFRGSLGSMHLDSPIVGISLTADAPSLNGQAPGYRLVSAAGGVYTFGTSFAGSIAGTHLSDPVVSISGNGS